MFSDKNKINHEVYASSQSFFQLDKKKIDTLIQKAKLTPRNRVRFCSHSSSEESVHEMFIVHPRGAYVRPHKHLNKPESMLIIEGKVDFFIFDDNGNIKEKVSMGDYNSGLPFYNSLRISEYHSMIIHTEWLVFLEVTKGPFNKKDTIHSEWSPKDEDTKSIFNFIKMMKDWSDE
jgi:cupin fold WbuC family metalloprotein